MTDLKVSATHQGVTVTAESSIPDDAGASFRAAALDGLRVQIQHAFEAEGVSVGWHSVAIDGEPFQLGAHVVVDATSKAPDKRKAPAKRKARKSR